VAAVGVLTGWGTGLAALPADARAAAGDRRVLPLPTPPLVGERFRRATRECLLGVAAVAELLQRAGVAGDTVRGAETGLVYVTAGAYGASNRAFIEAAAAPREGGALHFPYTAPSAVAAEVAIEFGLTGPYIIMIGGATATLDALWQAERLLAEGACRRVLVLAVETFVECAELYRRARWLVGWPLVEAAVAALLLPGGPARTVRPVAAASALERLARQRAGETIACAPLIELALAEELGEDAGDITGRWRGQRAALTARREGAPARPRPGRIVCASVAPAAREKGTMEPRDVLEELKAVFVSRLKFEPRRLADVGLETALPKGVEGSVGLDSLDFIELSLAIEDRFGVVVDEAQDDLAEHFATFDTLSRFILERAKPV
jgi:acyl carrier protein